MNIRCERVEEGEINVSLSFNCCNWKPLVNNYKFCKGNGYYVVKT